MPTALRRGLILLLSLTLLGASSLAQAASPPFTDLADVPWAVPGITALQQQGVLLGLAPGVFGPSDPVSRAQMATVLGRMLGWQPASASAKTSFQDAATIPAYALPYVATAAQDGIILGLPGGLFAPYDNVTWAQLAVIAARAYTYPQVLGNQIPPLLAQLAAGTETPAWAVEAVAQDVQAGDLSGVLADLYQPDQPVTRAELAAFLLQVEQSKGSTAAPVSGAVAAGQVMAVSASDLTIGNRTLPIAGTASVYVGSAPSNLSAVQVGDTVSAVISGGQAILINVTATPSSSPATTLSGTVASLSATQLGLTVTGQSVTVELPLGATVAVTLNGATSAISAVQPGEQATVSLDASGNVSGIAITNTGPVTATGTVDSVSATEIVITAAGGAQATYPLATDVTVNGLAGNLAAVSLGAAVTLTLSGGQVTAIQTGAAGTLAVATTALPAGVLGAAYSATLTATGGAGGNTWTATGSLPGGLSLASDGVLSGTPTVVGTFTVPVAVQDSSGATATASLPLTVTATAGALSITTSTLPAATEAQPYTQTLQAAGGSGGDIWSYSGTLPAGLTLSTAGVLSGTPDTTGTFSIVPAVRDSAGDTASIALTLTVNPGSTALAIATSSLPAATLGQLYSTNLAAAGGAGGYTWQYAGAMPPGLTLMTSGQLTGTPTAAGTYTVAAIVTDSAGATASANLTLTVASGASPLAIATASLPAATVGVAYSTTLTATGGTGGYFWTFSGALASGLSLSQSGVLSGTPTTAGTSYVTVTVRDGAGDSASEATTLTVSSSSSGSLSVTTASLPQGTVGQAYMAQLSATGGSGSYTWTYTGNPPYGLSITSGGAITGTPTAAGTYTFSVQAVDTQAGLVSPAQQLSITVAP